METLLVNEVALPIDESKFPSPEMMLAHVALPCNQMYAN
jgi:hypothetical protein